MSEKQFEFSWDYLSKGHHFCRSQVYCPKSGASLRGKFEKSAAPSIPGSTGRNNVALTFETILADNATDVAFGKLPKAAGRVAAATAPQTLFRR